jgi:hypothetical protein
MISRYGSAQQVLQLPAWCADDGLHSHWNVFTQTASSRSRICSRVFPSVACHYNDLLYIVILKYKCKLKTILFTASNNK